MGCLNSNQGFSHWFANIHLSGNCNRSCYFCIGQHMMELDSENNLDKWPLTNIDKFVEKCNERNVKDIFVTGTNTDPMLYEHHNELTKYLRNNIQDCKIGIRTNAAVFETVRNRLYLYDNGSITICSTNTDVYRRMMGSGYPPHISHIVSVCKESYMWKEPPKVNIVLGPENIENNDFLLTIGVCERAGIKRINLREPYGQPTIGNPLEGNHCRVDDVHGMPTYSFGNCLVTYWDVHYCECESVNIYANGRISEDYPITRGHSENGIVLDQNNFTHGRHREQWVKLRKK